MCLRTIIKFPAKNPSISAADQKAQHIGAAQNLYRQAKVQIEENLDWKASAGLILKALREERKALGTVPQVVNVIRNKPKTRLEFNFRS